jgi:hypothetical protein
MSNAIHQITHSDTIVHLVNCCVVKCIYTINTQLDAFLKEKNSIFSYFDPD